MLQILSSQTIEAPRPKVFQMFSDFDAAPQRVKGIKRIERLTQGPVGVGTRFKETRVMFGREATEEMEVTQFRPGESYTVRCVSCGAEYHSRFRFSDQGKGTRVDVEFSVRPISLLARLMRPLAGLMSGTVKKCMMQDIEDLKRALEGGS